MLKKPKRLSYVQQHPAGHFPYQEPPAPPSRTWARLRGKGGKRIVVIACIFVVVSGIMGWTRYQTDQTPIPEDIRQQIAFEILYPARLPKGYKVNTASFRYDSGVLTYSADEPGGNGLVFSVQKKPESLDFGKFYENQLDQARAFAAPAGQATIGKFMDREIASLISESSWMLIRPTGANLESDVLKELIMGVKKS